MPYSTSRPPKDLRKAIKKRHPKATENEIKQFINVWNSVFKKTNSEASAFSQAWGVLNKNKKLKSSHEKTDPEQTKKDVKKWNKKHKIKPPKKKKKKKSELVSCLIKLADYLDEAGLLEEADIVDSIMNGIAL
jgi:hypothetical protein